MMTQWAKNEKNNAKNNVGTAVCCVLKKLMNTDF